MIRFVRFVAIITMAFPLLAVCGVVMVVHNIRGVRRARQRGVSFTAVLVLVPRWVLHRAGTRPDEVSGDLLPRIPFWHGCATLTLFLAPFLFARRVTGCQVPGTRYPQRTFGTGRLARFAFRTTFFDGAIDRHRPAVDQLVILGAGFDTRAFTHAAGLRVFEVDAPKTQALKQRLLAEAWRQPDHVTFVPVDFTKTPWLDALKTAGFDPALPTFVLWEGVSYYLPVEVVTATLRAVASLAPKSVVAFDYFSIEHPRLTRLRKRMASIGEPYLFGLPSTPPSRAHAEQLVESCGLRLEHHEPMGEASAESEPLGGFVVATVAVEAQDVRSSG